MIEQLPTFFAHHWPWSFAFLIVLALIYLNERFAQKNNSTSVSTEIAIQKINHENAVIFDLRDSEAFRREHIINSVRASKQDFSEKRFSKYKEKAIILVCTQGMHSVALVKELKTLGYTQVTALNGGISAWKNANLPLIKGKK